MMNFCNKTARLCASVLVAFSLQARVVCAATPLPAFSVYTGQRGAILKTGDWYDPEYFFCAESYLDCHEIGTIPRISPLYSRSVVFSGGQMNDNSGTDITVTCGNGDKQVYSLEKSSSVKRQSFHKIPEVWHFSRAIEFDHLSVLSFVEGNQDRPNSVSLLVLKKFGNVFTPVEIENVGKVSNGFEKYKCTNGQILEARFSSSRLDQAKMDGKLGREVPENEASKLYQSWMPKNPQNSMKWPNPCGTTVGLSQ